jgi:peptidoglycan/xylan/chitin deacetylase (PgdA/CDA1 family)
MKSARLFIKSIIEETLSRLPRERASADLILAYHNVVPDGTLVSGDRSLHLEHSDFRNQLDHIQKNARVVPLQEILTTSQSADLRIAITFDDAYRTALKLGLTECALRNFPCTVFVSPGILGTTPIWDLQSAKGEWDQHRRDAFLTIEKGDSRVANVSTHARQASQDSSVGESCMIATLDELRSLTDWAGVTLGNHTMNHINCAEATTEELERELVESAEWLSSNFPLKTIPVLAYPYGRFPSDPQRRKVIASTVNSALAVDGGFVTIRSDRYAVPRWNIPSTLTLAGFKMRMQGWLL